jgi:hypothetical protein
MIDKEVELSETDHAIRKNRDTDCLPRLMIESEEQDIHQET